MTVQTYAPSSEISWDYFLYLLVLPLVLWAYGTTLRSAFGYGSSLPWDGLAVRALTVVLGNLTTLLSTGSTAGILLLTLPVWAMFWWYWFGLREMRWIPRAAWLLAATLTLLTFCARSPALGFHLLSATNTSRVQCRHPSGSMFPTSCCCSSFLWKASAATAPRPCSQLSPSFCSCTAPLAVIFKAPSTSPTHSSPSASAWISGRSFPY